MDIGGEGEKPGGGQTASPFRRSSAIFRPGETESKRINNDIGAFFSPLQPSIRAETPVKPQVPDLEKGRLLTQLAEEKARADRLQALVDQQQEALDGSLAIGDFCSMDRDEQEKIIRQLRMRFNRKLHPDIGHQDPEDLKQLGKINSFLSVLSHIIRR